MSDLSPIVSLAPLRQLSSMPPILFDESYQAMVLAVERRANELAGRRAEPNSWDSQAAVRAMAAAITRVQRKQLPLGADAQEVQRLAEAYNFAAAAAVLIERFAAYESQQCYGKVMPGYAMLLATDLLPAHIVAWLERNPRVLADWLAYFAGIKEAALALVIHDRPVKVVQTTRSVKKQPAPCAKPAAAPLGWDVISQLRAALDAGEISANQADSLVYSDQQGRVLLTMPDACEWYEARCGVPAKRALNRLKRLRLHKYSSAKYGFFTARTLVGGQCRGLLFNQATLFFAKTPVVAGAEIIDERPERLYVAS